MPRIVAVLLGSLLLLLARGCDSSTESNAKDHGLLPADPSNYAPLAGFGKMVIPEDNPLTEEKVALGRQLYYDKRLSGDGALSCYSCHVCENGLTDGRATAVGAFGKVLTRASPSLWNIGFHTLFYWDGRADSLEKQAFAAWKGANMGAGDDLPKIVETIQSIPGYQKQFQAVFGAEASADNIPQALAAYMRTIVGGKTPFDRWQIDGDENAVSDAAKRGYAAFQKANCTECHAGRLFSDLVFHNVGVGYDPSTGKFADEGRGKITKEERDMGAFKTPTLRDISQSAPYFHDGSAPTLELAVRYMLVGGAPNPQLDVKLKKADLSEAEIKDLIEFLKSLDEECDMPAPELPSAP